LLIALLLLSFLISGCVDLKSIRTFTDTSKDTTTYIALTEDSVKSLERRQCYESDSQQATLRSLIEDRKKANVVLVQTHTILSQYLSALGDMASDDLISFDTSLNNLTSAMGALKSSKGNNVFTSQEVNAVNKIATLLSNAFFEQYRQDKLKEAILSTNQDFQILIRLLINSTELYSQSLQTEKSVTNNYYQTIRMTAESNPPQDAALELLRNVYVEKLDAIDKKIATADNYGKILKKIGEGHQYLYDNIDQISTKQTLAQLKTRGQEIVNLYKVLHD
jgi:hypothetical protein